MIQNESNEESTKSLFEQLLKIGHQGILRELIKQYYEKNILGERSSQDNDRLEQLEQDKTRLLEEIDELLKEETKVIPEMEQIKEESNEDRGIENLISVVNKLTVIKTKNEKEIVGLEEKIKKLENIVNSSRDQKRVVELQRQTTELRGKLASKKEELTSVKEKLAKKDESVRREIANLRSTIDSQKNIIRGLEKEKKENREVNKPKIQLDKTQRELDYRIGELEHKLKEIADLASQTQNIKLELDRMINNSKIKLDGDKRNQIKKLFVRQAENDNSKLEDIRCLLGRKLDESEINALLYKKNELVQNERELASKILKISGDGTNEGQR
ncbi:hypothetical protein C1645_243020 [Glomus cerebriforme]|uniref:Uncharacterized protein n=1 Tax=Glomus cerebriforme TaxID=658196 RepID=A0A397SS07_9GLOM|nr:hypothetical protein C1645_243020 [Glomus cerebriforme]